MNLRLRILPCLAFFMASLPTAPASGACEDYGAVVYVKANATGANNGTSWANAFTKLQDALAAACSCANVTAVWVAAGTYYPDEGTGQANNNRFSTFQLCNGVAIYGGFAGNETMLENRNWTLNVTTLSGDIDQVPTPTNNAYHVVTGSGTNSTAVLDGFTITAGNANSDFPNNRGAGIQNHIQGSPTIRNCVITANNAFVGAGMSNFDQSSPLVTHTVFSNNVASVVCGAVVNEGGGPNATATFEHCDFINNTGTIETGAVGNTVANPVYRYCTFKGNSAAINAGAMHNWAAFTEIHNCVFSGNKTNNANGNGGALFLSNFSNLLIVNTTISGNSAGGNGGAIFCEGNSDPQIMNTIIWNNRAAGLTTSPSASVFNLDAPSIPVFSYSLVANSGGSANWNGIMGANGGNNIDANPLFVQDIDPATAPSTSGNLRLTASSPARDTGNPLASNSAFDLDGNDRISSCEIDMGPYELQAACPPPPVPPACPPAGNKVYVDAHAMGANDGASWANAFLSLQDGLTAACSCANVTEIWVADGTYYPDHGYGYSENDRSSTFQLCNGVAVYGGFAGGENILQARNWEVNIAILSGDIDQIPGFGGNAYHVVTGSGTNPTAVLDGFSIQYGSANGAAPHNHGGGIFNINGSLAIRNCTLSNNSASLAAGMFNQSSHPEVTNCTFIANSATVVTGAVFNKTSSAPVFRNCDFISNTGSVEMGAISNEVSNPVFINCRFMGNHAVVGAAGVVFNWASNPNFTNCLFSGNRAGGGGGAIFSLAGSAPTLINCTFSGNRAGSNGGALFNGSDSHPVVVNCIIWNNLAGASTATTSASVYNENNATATFSYSLIANSGGSSSWNSAIGINGGNNIASNPLFVLNVDPATAPTTAGNLRLTSSSPAKDAGNTAANFVEEFDLDGNPRRAGCIDMGAYEFVQQVPPCPGFSLVSLQMTHPCLTAGEDSLFYYPTWSEKLGLKATLQNGMTVDIPPANASWTSSHPARATAVNGVIKALTPGVVTISAQKDGVTGTLGIRVIAPALPPVFQVVPVSMSTPTDECAVIDMPVLIIRYIPTVDGTNLDVSQAPDFWWLNPMTVSQMEQTLWNYDERVRFALEEGTRFRDYGQHTTGSYLGYRVVDIISVYESIPRGEVAYYDLNGLPCFENDYFAIFERFDLEHYVRDLGVKEVWLWAYGMDSGYPSYDPQLHSPCKFRFSPESNMASPLTGDVSNSVQKQNDLPIYNRTYIVYGQNMRRSQAEALHNHGHQIERMIPHINFLQAGNTDLFWKNFVGQDNNGNFITGRCGWTHMPPNTTGNYDYLNPTLVASDIKSWTPAGGAQTLVNVNTWGNANYIWPGAPDFPQRIEAQWYIYWFQSLPGNGNTIPYGGNFLTNWWNIIGDWDKAITSGYGVYAPTPTGTATKNEVVKTLNTGYGSLRSVISCAANGSTITFHAGLPGQPLSLLSPVSITKNITLDAGPTPGILLNASASTYAFDVLNTGTLHLKALQIQCGTSLTQSGIRNFGMTTLHNTILEGQTNGPVIYNKNLLSATGANSLLKN